MCTTSKAEGDHACPVLWSGSKVKFSRVTSLGVQGIKGSCCVACRRSACRRTWRCRTWRAASAWAAWPCSQTTRPRRAHTPCCRLCLSRHLGACRSMKQSAGKTLGRTRRMCLNTRAPGGVSWVGRSSALWVCEGLPVPCAQVKLVKDAREQAVTALQKEPRNDLAQHLMGRCAQP